VAGAAARKDGTAASWPAWLAIWIIAAAAIAIGYALAAVAPDNPAAGSVEAASILLPNTVGVFPEPRDRFMFVSVFGALAGLFALVAFVQRTLGADWLDARPIILFVLAVSVVVARDNGLFDHAQQLFAASQWMATGGVALVIAWFAFGPRRAGGWTERLLLPLLFVVGAAMIALQRIWTLDSASYRGGIVTSHYEAVTSAIVRIASGGTCLGDVMAQYGCYGEFLAPLMTVTGSTILSITSIFAVLTAVALALALVFASTLLRTPAARVGCTLGLVAAVAINMRYYGTDPIFQYFPLRFLFPAISLAGVLWYQRRPAPSRAAAMGVCSGAAIAWNLESGIAVTGALAWMVTMGMFSRIGSGDPVMQMGAVLRRAVAFVAGVAAFLVVFAAYLGAKSAVPLQPGLAIVYQTVFSLTGFGMIPIPPFPDFWSIHVGIVAGSLLFAVLWLGARRPHADPALERAAFLAILAVGLLLYYVGRSHTMVLRLAMWPGIILAFFLLDRAYLAGAGPVSRFLAGTGLVLAGTIPGAFVLKVLPDVEAIASSARAIPATDNQPVVEDIGYIRARSAPGERIAVVALNQGILLGESGRRSALEGPGVAEMIRRVDRDRQVEALLRSGPDKVFLGPAINVGAQKAYLGTDVDIDVDSLRPAYALAEFGPGGRLLLLRRKPYLGTDLLDHGVDQ